MAETNENSVATETTKSQKNSTKKEQPVISQAKARQKVRFVIVSEGQGGASIGMTLKSCLPNNPYMIAVNTSDQDLDQVNLPDSQKFKIGGANADGAGKNRNRAKAYFKGYSTEFQGNKLDALKTFVAYYEEILFHPEVQTIIINCFSADGGTGSGIGPMLTTYLTNYVNKAEKFSYNGKVYQIDDLTNIVPRPVVIGVVPKCSVSAGQQNLQNTIECFVDIQNAIDKGLANFFIADNNLPSSVQYTNTNDMYRIINARIAMPILKFLGIEMNSSLKCMDLQDKVNTLRIPGCSAFTSISSSNKFQFAVPRGQSCKRIVEMLKFTEDGSEEKAAKQIRENYDIMSRDIMTVFFELDKMSIGGADAISKDLVEESMIGYFGFNSLNAIVEDLRVNLRRLTESNEKKAEVIKTESVGFSSVKEDAEAIQDAFGAKTMSNDELADLF